MEFVDPLGRSKEEYQETIAKIKSDSNVGIDAQYTHAIIIEYLKQLHRRIDKIEETVKNLNLKR